MRNYIIFFVTLWLLSAIVPALADDAPASQTVAEAYLGLSMGPLRQAKLTSLPKGTVLKADTVSITGQKIKDEIAKAGPAFTSQLQRNAFFVLENIATRELLLVEARRWATDAKPEMVKDTDANLIRGYLQSRVSDVTVTEEEAKTFYNENKDLVDGEPYDAVASIIRKHILAEKKQKIVDDHIRALGNRIAIAVDADWVKEQAATALDTPVDKARRSGKPSLVEFGGEGCRQCEMMAPILEELKQSHGDRCNVVVINVREEQILAERYEITPIPAQFIFDSEGKEVFRHVGFIPKAELLTLLVKSGVK